MEVVGSEIGQKMRSAIKAKLTELGCYVDDELPDYVMVMVANKRTRAQMEDDLQLFLGDNTELFVNWLHQVLKKLQEVTVTAPLKTAEPEKEKEKIKEKKTKEKKVKIKIKKTDPKKAKKKGKEKHRKKEGKKLHKSKKKSKHEQIRPNIPPLLMNIEKVSEPSITDVFAGQILKNHGITIDMPMEEKVVEIKPVIKEIKRPILPIIDPATIGSQPETNANEEIQPTEAVQTLSMIETTKDTTIETTVAPVSTDLTTVSPSAVSMTAPREEQIKEINDIEIKIQGLKQKLAEQLDSMSEDEDFLNIRTEAEELMNDFAEDVFQEISSQAPAVSTPPIEPKQTPLLPIVHPLSQPNEYSQELSELPQIELKLPKRPIRERLGAKDDSKKAEKVEKQKEKRIKSPERLTPEREPDFWGKHKSAKSRLGGLLERERLSMSDDSDDSDVTKKRVTSKVSRSSPPTSAPRCASVVRVRPRPRVQPTRSSLLMRAVADAHKSLLTIPPKVDTEPAKVKRAMVLPMRRPVDAQKILIHVPQNIEDLNSDDDNKISKVQSDEYIPASITKKIINTDYVPSRRSERTSSRKEDTLIIETINIHHSKVDKDKDTQFIVTMDGFNTNAFLAKKLMTEGLLEDEVEINGSMIKKPVTTSVLKSAASVDKAKDTSSNIENVEKDTEIPANNTDKADAAEKIKEPEKLTTDLAKGIKVQDKVLKETTNAVDTEMGSPENRLELTSPGQRLKTPKTSSVQKKRLSDTSEESDTQVIIKTEKEVNVEKRTRDSKKESAETPACKKRRASPIVFDVVKKEKPIEKVVEKERVRERTESASSDNHVIVTTAVNSHKYDAVPPLSQTQTQVERKIVWCRSFPVCRYGAACAFQHPRCKFAAACTRRNCPYSHNRPNIPVITPVVASHVVPAANYKTITPGTMTSICKYYPNCVNPACHFYHPKPCRYGLACVNKIECNFYHHDSLKWRHAV